jgi:catechol 2,3-dioxygenase-like lactoylglutathione lyase family enzyme
MKYIDANVTVMVSNMDRAIKFYTETLGLKLGKRYGDHWAEIQAPGMTIGLHPSKEKHQKGSVSIGLNVESRDKAVEELKKKGIEFHLKDDDATKLAFFHDPDGTELYLCEVLV